jgi:hypothetical protein
MGLGVEKQGATSLPDFLRRPSLFYAVSNINVKIGNSTD